MISKKNFVITIGNYGSVVALHESNEIKNKIFINSLLEDKLSSDKFNINTIKDFNYLLKSSPSSIKFTNIISKFNYFNSNKKYISLQDLFKDIQNSNFQIKSNE